MIKGRGRDFFVFYFAFQQVVRPTLLLHDDDAASISGGRCQFPNRRMAHEQENKEAYYCGAGLFYDIKHLLPPLLCRCYAAYIGREGIIILFISFSSPTNTIIPTNYKTYRDQHHRHHYHHHFSSSTLFYFIFRVHFTETFERGQIVGISERPLLNFFR